MSDSETFAARRRKLQAATEGTPSGSKGGDAQTHEDWNNFPNYLKFASFANAHVPQGEPKPDGESA